MLYASSYQPPWPLCTYVNYLTTSYRPLVRCWLVAGQSGDCLQLDTRTKLQSQRRIAESPSRDVHKLERMVLAEQLVVAEDVHLQKKQNILLYTLKLQIHTENIPPPQLTSLYLSMPLSTFFATNFFKCVIVACELHRMNRRFRAVMLLMHSRHTFTCSSLRW